ncbi:MULTISPECIES: class I SAM-dependent methyltransferase [unclassified Knoellia]|uniref:class I SAM-dependent methyltransferase n=1 Tax=Knoellia altitudinis TaxID=3404795 RepID=UPI0036156F0D
MTPVERSLLDRILWKAREAAFPDGDFVGQESFATASEIRELGQAAGLGEGVSVLDLCCGVAGPGLMLVRELGCDYLGIDAELDVVERARRRAAESGLRARFDVARVPPLPPGSFDVVLLLETLLAFRDRPMLFGEVVSVLQPGGRFAFTVEVGAPLTTTERATMPRADSVWLSSLAETQGDLEGAGLQVRWLVECTDAHRVAASALLGFYLAAAPDIREAGGGDVLDHLVSSHGLWRRWLRDGRVRKFMVVSEKVSSSGAVSVSASPRP